MTFVASIVRSLRIGDHLLSGMADSAGVLR
jgi:hypothetical protein